jgi:hypothetical protein
MTYELNDQATWHPAEQNDETPAQTAVEAFERMHELARATHWTKGELCKVITIREHGDAVRDKDGKVVMKRTHCLVGLAIRVVDGERDRQDEGAQVYEDRSTDDLGYEWVARTSLMDQVIDGLYEALPETWRRREDQADENHVPIPDKVNMIEQYNDNAMTERDDVLAVLVKAAERARSEATT